MTGQSFDVTYRVGFVNMNGFFAAWLKNTWFDRTNWKRFGIYGLGFVLLSAFLWAPLLLVKTGAGAGFGWGFTAFMIAWMILGALFFAFIFVFVVSPALTYLLQLVVFAFGPMRKRTNRVTASVSGIDKLTGDRSSHLSWYQVHRMAETKKTILLFTNRNCATIIPKSAFATPAEAEAFATLAKAQWDEAQSVF